MGTLSLRRMQASGEPRLIVTLPEADSQSFHQGQFVYLVNGEVTACASNGVVILGMAMHDASTVRYTDCDVLLALPAQAFMISCSEASAAAIARTDIGVKLAIRVADNRTYLDPSDTSYDAMVAFEALHDGITDSTVNPVVLAFVLPEAFQFGAAAT